MPFKPFIAMLFILGFPLMKRLGIAPFDLSPQFLFPGKSIPPGISLGLSIPYCSVPFIILLTAYSLHLSQPFIVFNLYALFTTLPALGVIFVNEKFLRSVNSIVPAIPPLTGFLLILSLGMILDFHQVNLYVSSLLQEKHGFYFLLPLMLLLGFLTSLGPSTLPLLPVVFGVLVTRHSEILGSN
ncbi:MAG: hypothetical protein Q9N34_02085 [Aquificota bacterium]|nr:hypothetical protein [Aquificota bacterium]